MTKVPLILIYISSIAHNSSVVGAAVASPAAVVASPAAAVASPAAAGAAVAAAGAAAAAAGSAWRLWRRHSI